MYTCTRRQTIFQRETVFGKQTNGGVQFRRGFYFYKEYHVQGIKGVSDAQPTPATKKKRAMAVQLQTDCLSLVNLNSDTWNKLLVYCCNHPNLNYYPILPTFFCRQISGGQQVYCYQIFSW